MQLPVTLPKSETPHPKKFRRRLLITAFLFLSLSLLLLTLAGTTASREEGLRLGSTTYTVEIDRDDSQDEWFDFHSRENSTSSQRRLSVGLPFGLLTIESHYYPGDALRKRLPRDVPSLIKHLAAKNRFEVKVAAQLLAEKRTKPPPRCPGCFMPGPRILIWNYTKRSERLHSPRQNNRLTISFKFFH